MRDSPGLHPAPGLRVRFVDDGDGQLCVLELEIPRSQEVLGEVHQALFRVGVHITHIALQVSDERIVERLRLNEKDGAPLGRDRHLEIQTTVLEVVQRRLLELLAEAAELSSPALSRPANAEVLARKVAGAEG